MSVAELLANERIIPVVVIDDAARAVPLAECLLEAGLGSIEITLRTDAALEAIRRVSADVPDMIVGAGSLRTPVHAAQVKDAGARFAVSPGYAPRLLEAARAVDLPMLPGAATASEMMQLLEHGYTLQKFFPAQLAGGIPYLKAVSAPIPDLRFVPTGGITVDNAADYLALPCVAAVGGSWITPTESLGIGDFRRIADLARAAAGLGM